MLSRGMWIPICLVVSDETPLLHVVKDRHQEQRIALGVTMDQLSQAFGCQRPSRFGNEVFRNVGFAKRLWSDLLAQVMNQQILL